VPAGGWGTVSTGLILGSVTRSRLLSSAAVFLAVVALLAAVRQVPRSLRTAHDRVEANAGLSDQQRELAPARWWGMNEKLLLRAEQILPRAAVYSVAAGRQEASVGAPLFYGYWLLPRRRTKDPRAASWIVLWGADRSRLGVQTDVVADLGNGAAILRVRR
jgi:hypothetical protein